VPVELIAIDPGPSAGWAKFIDGVLKEINITKGMSEFFEYLRKTNADIYVVEEFRLNPKINQAWNKLETSQMIGAVKFHAQGLGVKVVEQPANIKGPAYGLSGMKKFETGKKDMHTVDAVAHGNYYLHKLKENAKKG
jgi:hypothetical protein